VKSVTVLTLPRTVLSSTALEEGYDKVRTPRSRGFGLIRLTSTLPRPGLDAYHWSAGKKGQRGTGLKVISPSCPRRPHGVQGWPAIPGARRYSRLYRDRQNFTSRYPGVPASSYPIKGQARALQRKKKTQGKNQVPASKGTQLRDQHLKQSPPLYSFTFFETWARRPLSPACNPYASTSVQENTNLSPPLDVGPSLPELG
jgi:hypothetical protein